MSEQKPQRPIRELLREMREELGLSHAKMAKAAKFPAQSSYSHYESDKFKEAEIPIRHRQNIGDALFSRGISLERIRQLGPYTPSQTTAAPTYLIDRRIDALAAQVSELNKAVQLVLERITVLETPQPSRKSRSPKKAAS